MRARVVSLWALGWGASTLCWSGAAGAQQADTNPPIPNVLILLDNSGSMERMIDGSLPEDNPVNACNCTDHYPGPPTCVFPDHGTVASPVPNRWNTVQQAMTGYLQAQAGANSGFNCIAMPRTPGSTFESEYKIGGANAEPYDLNYPLSFHRMVAEDTSLGTGASAIPCVIGPGPLPGGSSSVYMGPSPGLTATVADARAYPTPSATVARGYGGYGGLGSYATPTCQFKQLQNGAITTMTSLMRFGLMTFDSDTGAGTGFVPATSSISATPFQGMWSYFPSWDTGSTCNFSPWAPIANCQGGPAGCTTQTWAVGARNGAAPPWEGRMVPLPTPAGLTQAQSNAEVAQVILASRPHGPTPIAGMFTAAQYYFQGDTNGPQSDPFVKPPGGKPCRQEYIILITDGAPNLDLQTSCRATGSGDAAGPTASCPFGYPESIAQTLYQGGLATTTQQFVTTFVIGFATSSFEDSGGGALIQCKNAVTSATLNSVCGVAGAGPSDPTFAPCCELEKIANYGGSGHAYFADTAQDLQSALGSILASIGVNATARTVPTFSPVLTAGNAQMYNAWLYPNPGAPWAGDIKRTNYLCPTSMAGAQTGGTALPPAPPSIPNGDDFAANLDLAASVSTRNFIAMQPTNGVNPVDSTASIRPYASTTAAYDGLSFELATTYTDTGGHTNIAAGLTDVAMGITPGNNSYPYTPIDGSASTYLTDTQTENMLLAFTFGQAKPGSLPSTFGWESRCPSCNDGNVGAAAGTSVVGAIEKTSSFGDIYHATPTVVGPPQALLDDVTYSGFRTFVTAGTTGGDAGTSAPRHPVVYAPTNDGLLHAFYADQFTNVQNEAWAMLMPAAMPQLISAYPATDKMLLDGAPVVKDVVWDRTTITASSCASGTTVSGPPGTGTCPWHTMLVAGYGPSQQGYYAVDVTSPTSPIFRWQLTSMPTGNYQIFGKHSATPAITTIALKDRTMSGTVHEVGVAILPGGSDGATTGGACERISHHAPPANPDSEPSGYTARAYVNCWGTPATYAQRVAGRSL